MALFNVKRASKIRGMACTYMYAAGGADGQTAGLL